MAVASACVAWWLAAAMAAATDGSAATLESLAARARGAGHARLADVIGSWDVPDLADRMTLVRIEPADEGRPWAEPPEWADGEEAAAIWRDFVEARKRRGAEMAAEGIAAARKARAAGGDRSVSIFFHAIREDPDQPQARAAIGWVRRDELWVWPEAAKRSDRGEVFTNEFGWQQKSRMPRFAAGERYGDGRWMDAAEAARPRPIERGWKVASDHWEIASTVPMERAMALATGLEETRMIWLQAFGGFAIDAEAVVGRVDGTSRAVARRPFAASLVRDRSEYASVLTPLEPAASRTLGLYWNPTRTAWFFDADDAGRPVGPARSTVLHETTHQLFAESRDTTPLAGERCGFWALEAVACFMESLEPAGFGWTLGGPTAGRVPVARERLLEDGFHVPIRELCGMGRRRLQADGRLPMIYSEIAGLAEFFLCGGRGRHREAFMEYLRRIYDGTAEPGTLASLCGRSFEELDDEYRRFMASSAVPPSR